MAMSVGSGGGEGEVMADINTTPLIDVMLVLLIMMIITIPVQTHAVKLNMPVSQNTPPPKEPTVIEVGIDFDGTLAWNGEVINDAQLSQRLEEEGKKSPDDQAEFHIRPNKLVKYRYVAHVMAMAQRDHVSKIGLSGNEQFL